MGKEVKEEKVVEQPTDGWQKQQGPPMWMPEVGGEELMGVVTDIVDGLYGNQYMIKPVGEEELIKTPSHKVLVNRMVEVKKGDMVKLIFVEEQPPAVKGQNPTKMYDVYIKEPED